MTKHVLARSAQALVTGALTAHLVATVLQNTPDSYNQDFRILTGGWPIPGWRFFAPTPGIQNVHLLVRHEALGEETSPWRDVTPTVDHGWRQVLINPGSRGPKALFDAMQQFSVMSNNQTDFSWVTETLPYKIVLSACRAVPAAGASKFQFLLVNVFPSAEVDRQMKPILASEWISVNPSNEIEGK